MALCSQMLETNTDSVQLKSTKMAEKGETRNPEFCAVCSKKTEDIRWLRFWNLDELALANKSLFTKITLEDVENDKPHYCIGICKPCRGDWIQRLKDWINDSEYESPKSYRLMTGNCRCEHCGVMCDERYVEIMCMIDLRDISLHFQLDRKLGRYFANFCYYCTRQLKDITQKWISDVGKKSC